MARHMAVLDRELTDIETGANKRLIVQMPPRHGKSFLTSGYFPAHYLGLFPDRNVISIGATDGMAMQFSRMVRDLIEEHGHLFGVSLRKDGAALEHWRLEQGGSLRAAGVGGSVMGLGADVLIVDDYFRDLKMALSETQRAQLYQWYLSTASTRLSPDGAQIIVCTRWHKKDLTGCVLAEAAETGEQWRVVSFPAIGSDGAALWPEQWPIEKLQAKKRRYEVSGYPWIWDALYQQEPPDVLDAEWPSHYFDQIWCNQWPTEQHLCVVALDPSLGKNDKSDYSAFVALAKGHDGCYYVDADLDRRPSRQIVDDGIEFVRRYRPDAFGCEAVAFQELLKEMFEEELPRAGLSMSRVFAIHTAESLGGGRVPPKRTRIRLLTPLLASGRIKIRRSPGSALLVEQLQGFPSHRHDDGPDALEMAIRLCEELLQGSGYEEPEEVLVA